jgi:hypothetical protein
MKYMYCIWYLITKVCYWGDEIRRFDCIKCLLANPRLSYVTPTLLLRLAPLSHTLPRLSYSSPQHCYCASPHLATLYPDLAMPHPR